jgi:mRNA interferase RelE/StbE
VSEPPRYGVDYESAAQEELAKLDKRIARRIATAASTLGANPRPAGCRRLVGYDNLWRIRVGDCRVIYTVMDTELIVLVLRIAHRSEVYR